jgi:HK97 family phage portal protein
LPNGSINPYSRVEWCRYQPYGNPPQDIHMSKILFFTNGESYDPEFNGIRFYSPLMHAFEITEVDTGMTFFLNDFVKHGAKFSGLISVEQTLNDTVAKDIQRRFGEYHGGVQNWSQPLVLGNGSKYETMQMNFRDMAFADLDARNEARICNAFQIDPIVANARAGLDVSSYNNKSEADKNWMHTWLVPSWQEDAEIFTNQLLPHYETNLDSFFCDFHTSEVWGLNEDRDSISKRTVEEAKVGIRDRDEAREALDLDPIDIDEKGNPKKDEEGKPVHTWLNVTIRESSAMTAPTEMTDNQDTMNADAKVPGQIPGKVPGNIPPIAKKPKQNEADLEAANAEAKKFRTYARKRVKEGKEDEIPEYEFKFVSLERQEQLLAEFRPPDDGELIEVLRKAIEVVNA